MLKAIKSFVAHWFSNAEYSIAKSKILCHIGKWYIVYVTKLSKNAARFYETGKLDIYDDYFYGKGFLNGTGWAVYHYRLIIMRHVFDLISLEPPEWGEKEKEVV